jgi:hypothetical protein
MSYPSTETQLTFHQQVFISIATKDSQAFKDMSTKIYNTLNSFLEGLEKPSIPFYSPRYSAHMCADQSMPAILGYIATMFYNPGFWARF